MANPFAAGIDAPIGVSYAQRPWGWSPSPWSAQPSLDGTTPAFQTQDSLSTSDELAEEDEQPGGSIPDFFGTNSANAASQQQPMSEAQRQLEELFHKLQQLIMQLESQMAAQDEEGARSTQSDISDVQRQITDLMGGGQSQNGLSTPSGYNGFNGVPAGSDSGAGFGAPGANAVDASPADFQGNNETGKELAAVAVRHATDGTGDGGHCYRNVADDLRKFGVNCTGEGAWEAADQLARSDKVQELKGISNQDLKKLPAGAIVVWNRGNGHEWGHISVATGDGREASDVMRNQITNFGTSYRVFMPVDQHAAA